MLSLIVAASLAATAADPSQTAASPPAATADPAKPDPASDAPKVICRREQKIGTNILLRTCKTKAEWDNQDKQVNRFMRDVGELGAQNTGLQAAGGSH